MHPDGANGFDKHSVFNPLRRSQRSLAEKSSPNLSILTGYYIQPRRNIVAGRWKAYQPSQETCVPHGYFPFRPATARRRVKLAQRARKFFKINF